MNESNESSSLHVLLLPSWYPSHKKDLNGSFFREQAHAIKDSGARVGVLAITMHNIRHVFNSAVSTKLSIEDDQQVWTYRRGFYNWIPRVPRISAWFFVQYGLRCFRQYIDVHGKPDVVHVHSIRYAGMLAKAIKEQYNIPFCITEHTSAFSRQLFSESDVQQMQPIVEDADCNIAVSKSFKKLLTHTFPDSDWEFIPNILPQQFHNQTPTKKKPPFVFANVSILDANKGIDILIQAFAMTFKYSSDVALQIVGDGPHKVQLQALANTLGVADKVHFLGAKPRDAILDFLHSVDSYVLSSHYETFGISLIEALAVGLPSVATRCGGPESIIVEPFNGYLCAVNDVRAMAKAMQNVYENYDSFDAAAIVENCNLRFGKHTVVAQIRNMYTQILQQY